MHHHWFGGFKPLRKDTLQPGIIVPNKWKAWQESTKSQVFGVGGHPQQPISWIPSSNPPDGLFELGALPRIGHLTDYGPQIDGFQISGKVKPPSPSISVNIR
jgi:hypothetical protein